MCVTCHKIFTTREDAEDCESRCQRLAESPRLEALNLSTRTFNLLYWSELYTVRDIAQMSEQDLKRIKGFGNWCLIEVKAKLAEYGIELNSVNDSNLIHKSSHTKPQPKKNIGRRIAHYRKERKLSQARLAAIVGMDNNYLSCIENGLKYPRRNIIVRLAAGLGVSVGDLTNQALGSEYMK